MMNHRIIPSIAHHTDEFIEKVLSLIEIEVDVGTATRLAEWLALYLWENACGIYRLDKIEELILAKCLPLLPKLTDELSDGAELHVASKVFRSGGHTPLMRCLMHESPHPVAALLTRTDQASEGATILGVNASQVVATRAGLNVVERVAFLAREMLRHQRVCLHIHPDDVVCAVALSVAKRIRPSLPTYFVNHADHVFSVGLASTDHVLEISTYGWMLRPQRGSVERSSFIGIPIARPESNAAPAPPHGARYALTGGASYKFRPLGGMSLPAALSKLLAADTTLQLIVIGASGKDWWWWPLRIREGKRVSMLKSVPKERYRQYLRDCTLYVDSYPWLGGTAFPEALMLGCRVAGMHGVAWGYSCADDLRSGSVDAFVRDCQGLINADAACLAKQVEVRARCVEYHSPATVRQRLDHLINDEQIVSPPPDQLANLPSTHAETYWRKRGVSVLPSRKKSSLTRHDMQRLYRLHASTFGPLSWSSVKLAFYAYLKKLD